jgi:hypothetical protein
MSNTLHTNYVKLTGRELFFLGEMTNFMGQRILFAENPVHGDEAPVIAICCEHMMKVGPLEYVYGAAANTTFFDIEDMYEGSDYEPLFVGDTMTYRYVIDNYDKAHISPLGGAL